MESVTRSTMKKETIKIDVMVHEDNTGFLEGIQEFCDATPEGARTFQQQSDPLGNTAALVIYKEGHVKALSTEALEVLSELGKEDIEIFNAIVEYKAGQIAAEEGRRQYRESKENLMSLLKFTHE